MKKVLIVTFLLTFALTASVFSQNTESAVPDKHKAAVEVAFVLDTTGSMGGLIQAAKEKIWAVVNTLATAEPTPEIRVGIIGYRDRSDDYITTLTGLTDDIDAVYVDLMAFSASGGGDTPESVNQALYEAVTRMKWSEADDVYKVIFLVGDTPPHMDYQDDVKYRESCRMAVEKGIYINTIQCGQMHQTTPFWKEISDLGEGRYFMVDQSGGAILAETPYDDELIGLSKDLDTTRLYFGDKEARLRAESAEMKSELLYSKAPESAMAARASFKADKAGIAGEVSYDLVGAVAGGRVNIEELDSDELPEEMKKMSTAEQQKFVQEQTKKRTDIQEKIKKVSEKRQEYIKEQIKKSDLKYEKSLDFAVFDCLKEQAGKKGFAFKDGPSF
jgi:Mg-chelatase subunit ChlD